MPTLQQQIAEKFLAKIAESGQVPQEAIEKLRTLLAAGKKVKADDLQRAFLQPDTGGDKK